MTTLQVIAVEFLHDLGDLDKEALVLDLKCPDGATISMSCARTRSTRRVSGPRRWAGFLSAAVVLFGVAFAFAFVALPFPRSVLILLVDASTISTSLSSASLPPSPLSSLPLAKLMVHQAMAILCPSAVCIACNGRSAVIPLVRRR